jgi:hypothetical protein
VNDKLKKTGAVQHLKKVQALMHHSTTLTPQPLQMEKTALHEKKYDFKKRQPKESELPKLPKDKAPVLSFPEVKGAEGKLLYIPKLLLQFWVLSFLQRTPIETKV